MTSNQEKQNELLARIIAPEEKIDAMPQCTQPAPSIPEGWKLVPVEIVDLYSFMCSAFTPMTPQQDQIAIQLDLAKRAMLTSSLGLVDQAMTRSAPSIPEGWLPIPKKHPTFYPVDLRLADGSVLCGCVPQSHGDYWWNGPCGEVFIDPKYAPVTHWRLAATPCAKGE